MTDAPMRPATFCRVAGYGAHSDDMMTVWHGRPTPLRMCGKHYGALGLHAFGVWRDILAAPDGRQLAGYVDVETSGPDAGAYTIRTGTGSQTSGHGDYAAAVERHGYVTGAGRVFLVHNGGGESYPVYELDWSRCPA